MTEYKRVPNPFTPGLKYKEVAQSAPLQYETAVLIPDNMLLGTITVGGDVWEDIEWVQVILPSYIAVVNVSRHGLELLNKARGYEKNLVHISAHWPLLSNTKEGMGFLFANFQHNVQVRLRTQLQEEKKVDLLWSGYDIPLHPRDLPDMRWSVITREEQVVAGGYGPTRYLFPPGGVLMKVIIDGITDPPEMTFGPGVPVLLKPYQLDSRSWCYNFTEGEPIALGNARQVPMKLLDLSITANVQVMLSPREKGTVKIISQLVYLQNWQ